jgi:hypothetical protein
VAGAVVYAATGFAAQLKKLRQVFDSTGISLLLSQVFRGSFLK